MRKAFRKAGLQIVARGLNGGANMADLDAFKNAALAQVDKWDLDAVSDAFLIEGTVAWSFPGPVTIDAIDQLPDSTVAPVLARMNELYAEAVPATLKN